MIVIDCHLDAIDCHLGRYLWSAYSPPPPQVITWARRCNKNLYWPTEMLEEMDFCLRLLLTWAGENGIPAGQERWHLCRQQCSVQRWGWLGEALCRQLPVRSTRGFQYERHADGCMLQDPKSQASVIVCCYYKQPCTAFSLGQECVCVSASVHMYINTYVYRYAYHRNETRTIYTLGFDVNAVNQHVLFEIDCE